MPWEPALTIRDPVHGNIEFTGLEKALIDLRIFQRLRGLKQSSLANYTYPTALTSRFEHSLGATHIAGKIVDHLFRRYESQREKLLSGLARAYNTTYVSETDRVAWRDVVFQGVRLAALYHDLGHLPFSHCFEEELQGHIATPPHSATWGQRYADMFLEFSRAHSEQGHGHLKLHEFLSYIIAAEHPAIKTVIDHFGATGPHAIALDILMPWKAEKRTPLLAATLIRIVRGELDCDRMDYIKRDAGTAGSSLGTFDTDRLILSLVLHEFGDQVEIWPSIRGLSALESFFIARLSIHRWQYHHHNVVFFDRLLRLIVRDMITGDIHAQCPKLDIVRDLAAWTFISPAPEPTSLGTTHTRDDGYLWTALTHVHEILYKTFRDMSKDAESIRIERDLVMLEELLFREKRHHALWKDQIGFAAFRRELSEAFARHLKDAAESGGDPNDRIGEFLDSRSIPKADSQVERLAGMVLSHISADTNLGRLQDWLWKTEEGAWFVVDYRDVTAFRRLKNSSLSSIKVCGRANEESTLYEMTKVSDVLAGLSSRNFQRVRFFAYVLDRYDRRPEQGLDIGRERSRLAVLIVRWLFDSDDLIDEESRRILRLNSVGR